MAVTTPPAGETPAPGPHRTRMPDIFTDAMLTITGIFGVWGVGLAVLTFIGIVEPRFIYSDAKSAIKAAGSTVVAVLALTQVWSMESAMGHLPRAGVRMRTVMRVHRYGGRIAIVLAALIAFFCMTDIGAPSNPARVAVHVFFGATAFAALGIKFALLRFRRDLAFDWAPWLGRYIAFAFVVVWIASGLAYYTGNL
jgi:hypothetical protein